MKNITLNLTSQIKFREMNPTFTLNCIKFTSSLLGGWKGAVKSAQDYYPFGMPMPSRTFVATSSSVYRFGFNGQEKDDEVSGNGNTNTAMYWEYDTRLGRRWNLDPKPTVGMSNYACFGDNPIWFCDIFGDKWKTTEGEYSDKATADKQMQVCQTKQKEFQKDKQKYWQEYLDAIDLGGKNPEHDKNVQDLFKKFDEAQNGIDAMQKEIDALITMGNDKDITFTFNDLGTLKYNTLGTGYISWSGKGWFDNSQSNDKLITINYYSKDEDGRPIYSQQGHENIHGYQVILGEMTPSNEKGNSKDFYFKDYYKAEQECYLVQYFIQSRTMPISITSYLKINVDYIDQVDKMKKP